MLDVQTTTLHHWIGGAPDTTAAQRFGDVTESATGTVVARVPFADQAVVDRAVATARAGFEGWRSSSHQPAHQGPVRVP